MNSVSLCVWSDELVKRRGISFSAKLQSSYELQLMRTENADKKCGHCQREQHMNLVAHLKCINWLMWLAGQAYGLTNDITTSITEHEIHLDLDELHDIVEATGKQDENGTSYQ